jgi:hypothetical protein
MRWRAKHGEPEEWDDVREVTWWTTGGRRPWRPGPAPPRPTPQPKDPEPIQPTKRPQPTPPPEPPTPPPAEPKEPGKGELNEEYGLYIERPFYIISSLGENRYMDVINERDLVIKTPNEYDSQKWYFDQRTLTIKNKMFSHKSLDINGSGKTTDMQIWNTNGKWW